jgi:hypothetical protein
VHGVSCEGRLRDDAAGVGRSAGAGGVETYGVTTLNTFDQPDEPPALKARIR